MNDAHTEDTARAVRRITWVGLGVNLVLSAVKLAAGVFGNSQALIADAVHSLSDSTTDVAVLVGSHFWSKPPDKDHPYGHRRIETIVSTLVALVLVAAGVGLVWNALATLCGHVGSPPGWIAFWAAVLSIVSKEILYRWTYRNGRRLGSLALRANAWHHRSDAFSSIPTALAVGGAALFPAWTLLDHVGAIIVSIFIFQAAFKISLPALRELIDSGAPEEDRRKIMTIARETDGAREVHGLRTRYVAGRLQVDLHVLVDAAITVAQGHDVAEDVCRRIVAHGPDVIDVVVHIEPKE